jgi:hypothetical protein
MCDAMQPANNTTKGRFHAQMPMDQAIQIDAAVAAVLRDFHVGGCHHCGFDAQDTIEKVAQDNGIPTQVLVDRLNAACPG